MEANRNKTNKESNGKMGKYQVLGDSEVKGGAERIAKNCTEEKNTQRATNRATD